MYEKTNQRTNAPFRRILRARLWGVLLACVCGLTAAFTLQAQSQAQGQQQTFTFNFQDKTIREIFRQIESGSRYAVLFTGNLDADLQKRETFSVSNASIDALMTRVLRNTDLTYKIVDRQILVSRREGRQAPAPAAPTVISGRVVDENGNPVAGASVVLKGTTTGTSTDMAGRYSFGVPAMTGTLQVSFIGLETKEVQLRQNATTYDVVLETASTQISDVVVTGYFNRNKESFTGTAVTVSGEELKKVNPNNLLKGIQAFDPSFRVVSDNAMGSNPNQMPNIQVRGLSAVPTGGDGTVLRRDNINSTVNLPTFILDGYEVGVEKIYDLDLNRVETVTLLKDAAATAIYGSRAANGVLVITTIAPKEGKLSVTYNFELSANIADLSSYDLLNAREKLGYEVDAGVYNVTGVPAAEQQERYYSKYYDVLAGVDTDWISQPVRNSVGQKHSVFIEGGAQSVRYGISGNYQNVPGVMKESGRQRYGAGMEFSYNANSKLLFRNNMTYNVVAATDSPYGVFSDYVKMNPYYRKTDSNGNVVQQVEVWKNDNSGNTDIVLNPLYNSTLNSFSKQRYWEFSDAFSVEWNIIEGLRARGLVNITHKNSTNDIFTSPYANEWATVSTSQYSERGRYFFDSGKQTNIDGNITLTYSKGFGSHFLNLALGANIRESRTEGKSFTAIGFTNDRFTDIGYAKGYAEGASPVSTNNVDRLFGSFLSVNYSYDNRYLIDLSGRLDGASNFGRDNKTAPFWAAGIGWNIHYENFMSDVTFISQLRLRANTGLTGSVGFKPYQANTLYMYDSENWYSTGVGVAVTQYGNENLKWQRTTNYDVGLEVGLFEDRFYFSGRYYYKLTTDMLADITLPPSTGFNYYKANLGDIKNTGYELGFKIKVFHNDEWDVNLTGNFAHNKNKLLKISNSLADLNDKADEAQAELNTPLLYYVEGQSMNTIYVVRSYGIDPENGKEIYIKKDGTLTYIWDAEDKVPYVDATPKLEGYFGGSVYYKGFMLNLSFNTRFGGYEYNQTLVDRVENADPRDNVDHRARKHRWVNPGDKALYKDVSDTSKTQPTSRFLQKDNLLELSSAYLSYDFNARFMQKIGMKTLRLAFTTNEVWRTSTIALERGTTYPFARTYTFSLSTSF